MTVQSFRRYSTVIERFLRLCLAWKTGNTATDKAFFKRTTAEKLELVVTPAVTRRFS